MSDLNAYKQLMTMVYVLHCGLCETITKMCTLAKYIWKVKIPQFKDEIYCIENPVRL